MTTMSDIGEKLFLKGLLPSLRVNASFVNGFGHDASIVDLGFEKNLAVKIDRAPFPVALRRGIGDFRTWGRLAVATNVSDLLAVGAKPHALMLSLVVPGTFDAADARSIVLGCEEACESHEIAFVGGDTKEGASAQVVGAAWGTVDKGAGFGRSSAKSGDYLFLAGRLGAFSGALSLIEAEVGETEFPREWTNCLVFPTARVKEGRHLRESGKVAAACDLSDGLAEALQIFCSSGAGIALAEHALPIHPLAEAASEKFGIPRWRFAFGVGDWAIACVVKEQDALEFRQSADSELELFELGRFDDTGLLRVRDGSGIEHEIPKVINEHFRRRLEDDGAYLPDLLHTRR